MTRQASVTDPNTNRMTSLNSLAMSYDAAGNQTNDGTYGRWFEAENRISKANGAGGASYYYYDASGKRVRRVVGGVETWQVYGLGGELVAEYNVTGTFDGSNAPAATAPTKEYGYRNGQLLVVWDSTETDVNQKLKWLVQDHLGSTRMEVGKNGALNTVRRHDYAPFGEEMLGGQRATAGYGYTAVGVRQKFGSKERDIETGLDYFGARYLSSVQGRFTSADPLYIEMGRLSDPQQLNIYTYARNNPLKYIDPLGLDITVTGSEQDEYIKQLQKRLSYQVQVNAKTHKVEIVGKDGKALSAKQLANLGKGLSGAGLAAFNAITDTTNHATIDTGNGRDDPSVFFGQEMGATHKIDFADLAKLDKAGGAINAADAVLHETLEAYAQAKGAKFADAHNSVLEFGPALGVPRRSRIQNQYDAQGNTTGQIIPWSVDGKLVNGRPTFAGFITVQIEFVTPIPKGAVQATDKARIVDVRK